MNEPKLQPKSGQETICAGLVGALQSTFQESNLQMASPGLSNSLSWSGWWRFVAAREVLQRKSSKSKLLTPPNCAKHRWIWAKARVQDGTANLIPLARVTWYLQNYPVSPNQQHATKLPWKVRLYQADHFLKDRPQAKHIFQSSNLSSKQSNSH